MGVTIHFEGALKDELAFDHLLASVQALAQSSTWLTERIEPAVKKLQRVRRETEEDWDYVGPVRGLILYVHEDCDPVRLEFDENLYVQEFVKTQFAGTAIHVNVIEILRSIECFFEKLYVNDEGEYWDTANLRELSKHIENCRVAIERELQKDPEARIKVRTPEGRIMDLVR